MSSVWPTIDNATITGTLQEAEEKLAAGEREIVLDFSSVNRIDTFAIQKLERLVNLAEGKSIKVVLRSVNVGVYKVLKLVKLAPRICFVTT